MKFKQEKDLLAISIATTLFILFVIFIPSTGLRIILGLPFLLFFPGYTLIAALFPRKGDLDSVERIALGFGVSIGAVILTGLVLNFIWRLDVYPAHCEQPDLHALPRESVDRPLPAGAQRLVQRHPAQSGRLRRY